MNVREKLRFGSRRISTQKNVDLASLSASTVLLEVLAASTKKLAQNSFLDVMILPDAGCECIN